MGIPTGGQMGATVASYKRYTQWVLPTTSVVCICGVVARHQYVLPIYSGEVCYHKQQYYSIDDIYQKSVNVIVQRIAKDTRPTLGSPRAHVPLNNQLVPAESSALPFVTERPRWQKLIFQCPQPALVYNQPILWVSLVVRSTGSSTIWEHGCNYRREQMLTDHRTTHTHNAQRPMLNTTIN